LVGGRVADWGTARDDGEALERTRAALRGWDAGRPTTHVPADEVDEVRIVASWIASHDPPQLALDPLPAADRLTAFLAG
jgi:hypothetical protein